MLGMIEEVQEGKRLLPGLGETQAEAITHGRDPGTGRQERVSTFQTKSLEQVRAWVPSHSTLGTGLLSYPTLRVGVVPRMGVELR